MGQKNTTANSTLAIGGVSSPLDNFVVAESFFALMSPFQITTSPQPSRAADAA